MPESKAAELAFQLRKLAEAWWSIADAVELGHANTGARIIALVNLTEQAGNAALGMLSYVRPLPRE